MNFFEINQTKPGAWESLPDSKRAERYRHAYEQLMTVLSATGSVVKKRIMIQRTTKTEQPVWVTNGAAIEIIFPRQESTPLMHDASYNVRGNESLLVRRIDETYQFDPSQVTGHIYIYFSSDHNRIHGPKLQIIDLRDTSELSDDVCDTIQGIFKD